MKLCTDCRYYEYPDRCTYHHDPKSLLDGGRSFRFDSAKDMRYGWPYFWFWNCCGESGRLWKAKEAI